MRFHPSDTIWLEVTTMISAIATKWRLDHKHPTLMTPKAVFIGKLCKYLSIDNMSHLEGVISGYRVMEECSLSESTHCPGRSYEHLTPHDNPYIHRIQQVFFGHSYERLLPIIERTCTGDHERWEDLLNFSRHVRNGCYHGNRFRIHGNPKPVIWRGFQISHALDGRHVMGITEGCFGVADVIALLYDIQQLLNGKQ